MSILTSITHSQNRQTGRKPNNIKALGSIKPKGLNSDKGHQWRSYAEASFRQKKLPPIQYGCYNRERAYWSFLRLFYTLKFAIFAELPVGFALDPLGALGDPQTPRLNFVLQVRYSYAPGHIWMWEENLPF